MKGRIGIWLAGGLLFAGLLLFVDRIAPQLGAFALFARWSPVLMVAVGALSAVRLEPRTDRARGPLLFAAAGVVLLLFTQDALSGRWLPPLALCAAGMVMLFAVIRRRGPEGVRPVERFLLVGLGRRIHWQIVAPTVLTIRAVASGAVITVPANAEMNAARLEVTAVLSDIEVVVPAGWTVFVDLHRAGDQNYARSDEDAMDADLQVLAFCLFGRVRVRTELAVA